MTNEAFRKKLAQLDMPDLGGLIRVHREEKDLSRAKLSKLTKINENSLSKYEKAGQKGGQFPSVAKMASLCSVLDIDPSVAMVHALTPEQIREFGGFFLQHNLLSHMADSVAEALGDEEASKLMKEDGGFMLAVAKEMIGLRSEIADLRELTKQNGPDQIDPSRPGLSKNNAEAVDAASTNPTKGKTDEVA